MSKWERILKKQEGIHPFIRIMGIGDNALISADYSIKRMCRAGKEHLSQGLYDLSDSNEDLRHIWAFRKLGHDKYDYYYASFDDPDRGTSLGVDEMRAKSRALQGLINESKEVCFRSKKEKEQKEIDERIKRGESKMIEGRLEDKSKFFEDWEDDYSEEEIQEAWDKGENLEFVF